MAPSASAAVRFVPRSKRAPQGLLQLRLHVKPGASKSRQAITAVTDDFVELCVAAQARDGEANRAVIRLLGDTLGLPKTTFCLAQGAKSRDKTVLVQQVKGDGPAYAHAILGMLRKASVES